MHVISRKKLFEASATHGGVEGALDIWYRIARRAEWTSIDDVRKQFPSAGPVETFTVFNIKGNTFRLIAEINYSTGRLYIRHVLTHAVYDKEGWKK